MDPTVPPAAAVLLRFIARIETSRDLPAAYSVLYGHSSWPRPITTMTVDEWIAAGPEWTRRHRSSAAGAYQFMNATLKDLKRQLGLRGSQVMDGNLQDRLAYHLLRRRGYDDWAAGKIDDVAFGNRLAMEWASLPVLSNIRGAHRQLTRGQSYYSGDALNKSLTQPASVQQVLAEAKAARLTPQPAPAAPPPLRPAPAPPAPPITLEPLPDSSSARPGLVIFIVVAAVAAIVAAVTFLPIF